MIKTFLIIALFSFVSILGLTLFLEPQSLEASHKKKTCSQRYITKIEQRIDKYESRIRGYERRYEKYSNSSKRSDAKKAKKALRKIKKYEAKITRYEAKLRNCSVKKPAVQNNINVTTVADRSRQPEIVRNDGVFETLLMPRLDNATPWTEMIWPKNVTRCVELLIRDGLIYLSCGEFSNNVFTPVAVVTFTADFYCSMSGKKYTSLIVVCTN